MYNVKNSNLNEPMTDIFEVSNNEFHNLRSNAINFHIQKPKTNFLKKRISYFGTLLWNSLPISAKEQDITINQFKSILGSQYCL